MNALFLFLTAAVLCTRAEHDTDLPEDVRSSMLDDSDPKVRAQLLCSACHWSAVELHDTTTKLEGDGTKRPRQDMIDDALEDMCDVKSKLYGISVPDTTKKARPRFTRMKSRVDGAWITAMWLNECQAMVERLRAKDLASGWGPLRGLFRGDSHDKGQMKVEKFLALCPACEGDEMAPVYHPRMTSKMWMPIEQQLKEDWELSPDL